MTTEAGSKDPLHGVKLEMILKKLVEVYGWKEMAKRIEIRCFMFDPTITSSLRFLRQTPWARTKVEQMYLDYLWEAEREERFNREAVRRSSGPEPAERERKEREEGS